MTFPRMPSFVVLGTTFLALFAAGCGSGDNGVASKTANEILAATKAAATSASSVHVNSTTTIAGGSVALSAVLSSDSSRARATLFGSTFEVVRVGNVIYIKGDQAFAARLGRAFDVMVPANTWIKGSATGSLGRVTSFTQLKIELPVLLGGVGTITKGAATTVNGRSAIEVKQQRKLSAAMLYVATTGQPYPLQLNKHGREAGQTTFTNWNEPVHVDPPTSAIELSQLPKTGG
jgi:hypothetical protein